MYLKRSACLRYTLLLTHSTTLTMRNRTQPRLDFDRHFPAYSKTSPKSPHCSHSELLIGLKVYTQRYRKSRTSRIQDWSVSLIGNSEERYNTPERRLNLTKHNTSTTTEITIIAMAAIENIRPDSDGEVLRDSFPDIEPDEQPYTMVSY